MVLLLLGVRQPQLPLSLDPAVKAAAAAAAVQRVVDQGIGVDFSSSTQVKAGDPVSFAFNITDATPAPISGVRPAAWLSLRSGTAGSQPADCTRKVATYLGANLFRRPDLDLN